MTCRHRSPMTKELAESLFSLNLKKMVIKLPTYSGIVVHELEFPTKFAINAERDFGNLTETQINYEKKIFTQCKQMLAVFGWNRSHKAASPVPTNHQ